LGWHLCDGIEISRDAGLFLRLSLAAIPWRYPPVLFLCGIHLRLYYRFISPVFYKIPGFSAAAMATVVEIIRFFFYIDIYCVVICGISANLW
jgi:hypothetical protein